MTKNIKQTVSFKTTPHQVYEALMDSRKHSRITGDRASISRKIGGRISAYGGYITGTNLELSRDKLIVQDWRASDWCKGHMSKVTFKLKAIPGGTRLTLTHRGVPQEHFKAIKQGWIEYYWQPMKALLEK